MAVLTPTTVLAFQHFETFKRRFSAIPDHRRDVSRFRTRRNIKLSVERLEAGKVDVAIGTHRILSKDIKFQDLGLVIVDEEQRFGVKPQRAPEATSKSGRRPHHVRHTDPAHAPHVPPGTARHVGDRDPPKDRLAIQTVVAQFDPRIIRSAIEWNCTRRPSLLRAQPGGFHLRARRQISGTRSRARIGVGHGQMGEADSRRLLAFMRHEFDVLVSTTIIENGLDIPLANTIIIESADRYGLSELYQLRGRVGRSNRRAYAYLLVPPDGTDRHRP